jgi:hypothetical protein
MLAYMLTVTIGACSVGLRLGGAICEPRRKSSRSASRADGVSLCRSSVLPRDRTLQRGLHRDARRKHEDRRVLRLFRGTPEFESAKKTESGGTGGADFAGNRVIDREPLGGRYSCRLPVVGYFHTGLHNGSVIGDSGD